MPDIVQPVSWRTSTHVLTERTVPLVERLCEDVLAFYGIDEAQANASWAGRFVEDTELAWTSGHPAIDDL